MEAARFSHRRLRLAGELIQNIGLVTSSRCRVALVNSKQGYGIASVPTHKRATGAIYTIRVDDIASTDVDRGRATRKTRFPSNVTDLRRSITRARLITMEKRLRRVYLLAPSSEKNSRIPFLPTNTRSQISSPYSMKNSWLRNATGAR